MKAQFITTDSGDELVLLARHDYDVLRASAGDEEAEDRVTERMVAEARVRIAAGEEELIPAGPDGRPLMPKPFGERVRIARKAAGLSQMELAAEVGISQNYLSQIESGQRGGDEDILKRLAVRLDLDT